jgi:hypothetical protein
MVKFMFACSVQYIEYTQSPVHPFSMLGPYLVCIYTGLVNYVTVWDCMCILNIFRALLIPQTQIWCSLNNAILLATSFPPHWPAFYWVSHISTCGVSYTVESCKSSTSVSVLWNIWYSDFKVVQHIFLWVRHTFHIQNYWSLTLWWSGREITSKLYRANMGHRSTQFSRSLVRWEMSFVDDKEDRLQKTNDTDMS